jgi:hypothetical protein
MNQSFLIKNVMFFNAKIVSNWNIHYSRLTSVKVCNTEELLEFFLYYLMRVQSIMVPVIWCYESSFFKKPIGFLVHNVHHYHRDLLTRHKTIVTRTFNAHKAYFFLSHSDSMSFKRSSAFILTCYIQTVFFSLLKKLLV